jgi:hypothetical protein
MKEFEHSERKENRRKKIDVSKNKTEQSEEYRFVKKRKNQLKKRLSEIKEEELWEDWEIQ